MNETELRKHRCCFTGHRPEKLNLSEEQAAMLLENEIQKAIERQFTTFTGMAKGVDIIAAEIVLRLREQDSRLKLICALPYPNFGQRWCLEWKGRLQSILNRADEIYPVSPTCSYRSYQQRNEWMCRHADLVIAVFNGKRGGTKNTLEYARTLQIPCVIIHSPEEGDRLLEG